MPNGDDQPTATNPKTGEVFKYDGKSWVSVTPPKAQSKKIGFGGGLAESFGSEPTFKGQKESTESFYKSLAAHPLDTLKSTAGAGVDMLTGLQKQVVGQQFGMNAIKGAGDVVKGYKEGHLGAGIGKAVEDVVPFGMGRGAGTIARGETARGAGQLTGSAIQLATMARAPENPDVIAQKSGSVAQNALQEIVNKGATHEKMQQLVDADALGTKATLAGLEQKVKADVSARMEAVSRTVDKKFPQGSVDGAEVASNLQKDLGAMVKAKTLRAKLPGSLQKLLDEAEGTSGAKNIGRLSQKELTSAMAIKNMMKKGMSPSDARGAALNMGFAPKQIDSIMASLEASESGPRQWTFEQAKQIRTALADELFTGGAEKYPGAVKRAMFNTWKDLSTRLDAATEKAGIKDAWLDAKKRAGTYYDSFHGTMEHGAYKKSPISQALSGTNGKEIMEPLTGKSANQAKKILTNYREFVDPNKIAADVRRYGLNDWAMNASRPAKWDIIMAGIAIARPEYGIPMFLARYMIPRLLQKGLASRTPTESVAVPPQTP